MYVILEQFKNKKSDVAIPNPQSVTQIIKQH